MTELKTTVSKTIAAPADKLFDAWLDPEKLATFMLPKPGMPQPEVKMDARVGGRFDILMDTGESKIPHHGEYIEIDRPRRLVFSWNSPFSAEGSEVTIEFTENSPNETEITLTHIKFPSEESRNNHEAGWGNILSSLEVISTS